MRDWRPDRIRWKADLTDSSLSPKLNSETAIAKCAPVCRDSVAPSRLDIWLLMTVYIAKPLELQPSDGTVCFASRRRGLTCHQSGTNAMSRCVSERNQDLPVREHLSIEVVAVGLVGSTTPTFFDAVIVVGLRAAEL
jgi:hypothetical protein